MVYKQDVKNEIFVFGANLAGRHGAGAALYARVHHGAILGVGEGLTGTAYAIPTKDGLLKVLPLKIIAGYVQTFKDFARSKPDLRFNVTPIGTGLAGYRHSDIAPMFRYSPGNCKFVTTWYQYLY